MCKVENKMNKFVNSWIYEKQEKMIRDNFQLLKMTDCFLVISEAVVSMCLKNDISRNYSVKLYHSHKTLPLAWLMHDTMTRHQKQFFVIPLFNKKLHKNSLLCWWVEKQPFSCVFKHFLKFFTVNSRETFSIKDNIY